MKSILQDEKDKRCYLCMMLHGDERKKYTHRHHIFPGAANRKKSEELGLTVRLCVRHHVAGPEAVHENYTYMRMLQEIAQEKFEETHSREEWMREMGRNYIKV